MSLESPNKGCLVTGSHSKPPKALALCSPQFFLLFQPSNTQLYDNPTPQKGPQNFQRTCYVSAHFQHICLPSFSLLGWQKSKKYKKVRIAAQKNGKQQKIGKN